MLKFLGLDADQESVYRAMLKMPQAGVHELSLIRMAEPAPAEHRLVHPEVALTSLFNRSEEELLERRRQVTTMRLAVADLLADYHKTAQRVDTGEIQRFDGMDEIRRCIEGLSDACEFEVSVFATGGAQPQASLEGRDRWTRRPSPGGSGCATCTWRASATMRPPPPTPAG